MGNLSKIEFDEQDLQHLEVMSDEEGREQEEEDDAEVDFSLSEVEFEGTLFEQVCAVLFMFSSNFHQNSSPLPEWNNGPPTKSSPIILDAQPSPDSGRGIIVLPDSSTDFNHSPAPLSATPSTQHLRYSNANTSQHDLGHPSPWFSAPHPTPATPTPISMHFSRTSSNHETDLTSAIPNSPSNQQQPSYEQLLRDHHKRHEMNKALMDQVKDQQQTIGKSIAQLTNFLQPPSHIKCDAWK